MSAFLLSFQIVIKVVMSLSFEGSGNGLTAVYFFLNQLQRLYNLQYPQQNGSWQQIKTSLSSQRVCVQRQATPHPAVFFLLPSVFLPLFGVFLLQFSISQLLLQQVYALIPRFSLFQPQPVL